MSRAIDNAASVRLSTSPNPWVGCVVVAADGSVHDGATSPPGGPHAEVVALRRAGATARGSTVFVTLEPCAHHGRTPPCADALVEAGVRRVVVGLTDPDEHVAGAGIDILRRAGVSVDVGLAVAEVSDQLWPYLVHRRTGRPGVVLKLAATLDGRIAAPDGSSQWIAGEAARADAHLLRAASDAIAVGAGTVRADDPALTVRNLPEGIDPAEVRDPLRVVVGRAAATARIHPALEWSGSLAELLDELGERGVLQLMVEGGPTLAASFHREGLVDRYVLYLAPALFGGDDARGMFAGAGAADITRLWRGRLVSVRPVGGDLRVELDARS